MLEPLGPALCVRAFLRCGIEPAVTVVDLCETPLSRCRARAREEGWSLRARQSDILAVDAFYLNGSGQWVSTSLFRRNDNPDDRGFGVCSPGETCTSTGNPGGSGLGDANESLALA